MLNLRTQNEALLLKHLHKFFNREDIPWVHLVWKNTTAMVPYHPLRKKAPSGEEILKLLDACKGMTMVNIQDGVTYLFWDDLWLNRVPKVQFPELYSFARNTRISLRFAQDHYTTTQR